MKSSGLYNDGMPADCFIPFIVREKSLKDLPFGNIPVRVPDVHNNYGSMRTPVCHDAAPQTRLKVWEL
jgi:hypothetical protein